MPDAVPDPSTWVEDDLPGEELEDEPHVSKTDRLDFLRTAKSRSGNDPVKITARKLIALWNSRGRGHRITARIREELAAVGLVTEPDFGSGWIDGWVTLLPLSDDERQTQAKRLDEVALRVSAIPAANQGVESVTPQAPVAEAQTRMLLHDYSQLAVLAGARTLRGAVSWESISRSRVADPQAGLAAAIVPARHVGLDDDILPLLPVIAQAGYVFVGRRDGVISGIVTAADVTEEFRRLAGPFFLLGELERRLRKLVEPRLGPDELTALRNPNDTHRKVESVDNLSLGEIANAFATAEQWAAFGWALDHSTFREGLEVVRKLRNGLMHFSPDRDQASELRTLESFAAMLRTLDTTEIRR